MISITNFFKALLAFFQITAAPFSYNFVHPLFIQISKLLKKKVQGNATPLYKVKYYLIKAHLKIRTKETATTIATTSNLSDIVFPETLLDENETNKVDDDENTSTDDDASFIMNKMLNWIDKNITSTTSTIKSSQSITSPLKSSSQQQQQQQQEDVQELEEEQEVQEVEMFGESDTYDPVNLINSIKEENDSKWSSSSNSNSSTEIPTITTASTSSLELNMDELLRLTTSASFFYNQQRLNACASLGSNGVSLVLDNHYLVHLLAINKNENVFRVKQIHDYYGGCFICGKQVDFNMKHYQVSGRKWILKLIFKTLIVCLKF